jgi:hypothetical protein
MAGLRPGDGLRMVRYGGVMRYPDGGGLTAAERATRLGVPGLRGPRALEQLALLLVSIGELTAAGLQLVPAKPAPG